MTPSQFRSLVARFEASRAIPHSPLSAPAAERGGGEGGGRALVATVADIVVDLDAALDLATEAGAHGLDVFADTIVLPAGFDRALTGPVRRLSLVARRLCCEGEAVLRMVHDGSGNLSAVRLAVQSLDRNLAVHGGPTGSDSYDLPAAIVVQGRPSFAQLGWREGVPASATLPVPPEFLAAGAPLHRVLAASFDLVAAIVGQEDASAEERTACHDILDWIVRWSGVEMGFGELARTAQALKGLTPVPTGNVLALPIPTLSAARCLALAEAQARAIDAFDALARSIEASQDLRSVTGRVVKAFADRDGSDLQVLRDERDELEKRLRGQIDALDAVARMLTRDELDAEIARLELQLQSNLARILRIVKLTFQIAAAVVAVAASVAALCVGAPPDPNAVTQQGLKGVKGIGDMFADAKTLGANVGSVTEAIAALAKSFAIPLEWAKHNADTLKTFADPAKSVLAAIVPVKSAPAHGAAEIDFVKQAENLGMAMRALADMPNVHAMKAAWSVLETNVVTMLDGILQDAEAEGDVKSAAGAYKAAVQRVAIHGRLLAEQMDAKSALARQLAALKLSSIATLSKQASLRDLESELAAAPDARQRLGDELALRTAAAVRGFFVAAHAVQVAQRYETGRPSRHRLAKVSTGAEAMQLLAALQSDLNDAEAASARTRGTFMRELVYDDPSGLTGLANGVPVRFRLDPDHPDFAPFRRMRTSSVEAWILTSSPAKSRFATHMTTGSSFSERGSTGEEFFAMPLTLRFEHKADKVAFSQVLSEAMPPPFTTWVIEVVEPKPLPIVIEAVRLVFKGQAWT